MTTHFSKVQPLMFRFDNYQQLHKHKLENVQQLLTRKMCILVIKMYNSSLIRVHPEPRKPSQSCQETVK